MPSRVKKLTIFVVILTFIKFQEISTKPAITSKLKGKGDSKTSHENKIPGTFVDHDLDFVDPIDVPLDVANVELLKDKPVLNPPIYYTDELLDILIPMQGFFDQIQNVLNDVKGKRQRLGNFDFIWDDPNVNGPDKAVT